MADTIGAVNITGCIDSFTVTDNTIVLGGQVWTRAKLDELILLFRDAPENTAVYTLMGDQQEGFDLTSDNHLTQVCTFDNDKLISGTYLLRRFRYTANEFTGSYPYSCELFLM